MHRPDFGHGGVSSYISGYRDVQPEYVYFLALCFYDKVCFLASSCMNSPSFHSHFNGPKIYILELT